METHQLPERVVSISSNAYISLQEDTALVVRSHGESISLEFLLGPVFLLRKEPGGWFVLPALTEPARLDGDTLTWVLAPGVGDNACAWLVKGPEGCPITVDIGETVKIDVIADRVSLIQFENRPHADIFGNRYHFSIRDGDQLEQAMAGFYWDTLMPCVVERTRAAQFPTPDGYVLSTLAPRSYPGTYPDVDHEFQVKGRLAAGSWLDEDVARRMMDLQFKLMREDPQGLWRNPCSLQTDGSCEYHVRRSSLDGSANANMFLVTGNIEILEEAWLYVASTKNLSWLQDHIADLEGAALEIEENIDPFGRLWSDVYYEDQVIQDGRVCDAQAFAANGYRLLAELEQLLRRSEKAQFYLSLSNRLAAALVSPLPQGYWDVANRRFTNWIDRNGIAHDHIHLLSNEMPVLFGYANPDQVQAVQGLINENQAEFQRFPSFVALDLTGYTESEIGVGGPYDLCAAGRYWCWDAAYWAWCGNGERLHDQLLKVAEEAARDGYRMGERYDMDYVYYVDGKNWHGAADYYEYPCVFTWVLIHDYLGVGFGLDSDLVVSPRIWGGGKIELGAARFALRYDCSPEHFRLKNLAGQPRTFRVDLSVIYPNAQRYLIQTGQSEVPFKNGGQVILQPGEECMIRPE